MAICLVLTVVTVAFASDSVPDPTIKANVDNLKYSYDILNQTQLPGIIDNGSSKVIPEGFNGLKQFEGNGIEISKIRTTAKVTICFALPNYQYGWTGKIYKWYDGKWTAAHSTLVEPQEGVNQYQVCNPYATNGTYALIVGYSSAK